MHIITSPPWGFMSAIIALIVQDYLLYYGEWSNQIANIYDLAKGDIKTFINKVNETFDKAEPKPLDFLLPYIRVWKINPLMPFQYVDFLAHLHLNYAYKFILQNITEPKITTDFITKLQARLIFDGKVIRQERLKQDMSAFFTIPRSELDQYNPAIITIDIMGLKMSYLWQKEKILDKIYYISSYNNKPVGYNYGDYPYSYEVTERYIKIWGSDQDPETEPHPEFNSILFYVYPLGNNEFKFYFKGIWTPHLITVYFYDTEIYALSGFNENVDVEIIVKVTPEGKIEFIKKP